MFNYKNITKYILQPFRKKNNLGDEFIYVIGDSHARAFSHNTNFFPLFLGQGKTHCFINEETYNILFKDIIRGLGTIKKQKIILSLGEPDTRYYLGKGWYPWKEEFMFDMNNFRPLVQGSFERYKKLLQYLRGRYENEFIVLNITPSGRMEQNIIVNYFNELLKDFCDKENFLFLDSNSYIYKSEIEINVDFLGDTVHLNNKIQPVIENILIEKGYLKESKYQQEIQWDNLSVKNDYIYNKKFGCYILK